MRWYPWRPSPWSIAHPQYSLAVMIGVVMAMLMERAMEWRGHGHTGQDLEVLFLCIFELPKHLPWEAPRQTSLIQGSVGGGGGPTAWGLRKWIISSYGNNGLFQVISNNSSKWWTFLFPRWALLRNRSQEREKCPCHHCFSRPQDLVFTSTQGRESWGSEARMSHHLEWGERGGVTSCPTPPSAWVGLPIQRMQDPSASPWVEFPKAKCWEANHCSEIPLGFNDHRAENSSKNKVRLFKPKGSERRLKGREVSSQVSIPRLGWGGEFRRRGTQALTPFFSLWSMKFSQWVYLLSVKWGWYNLGPRKNPRLGNEAILSLSDPA